MYKAILHILAPIIAASIINAIIYLSGWSNEQRADNYQNKLLPPGYVIAIVWVIILGLLGYAHYLVFPSYSSAILVLAILFCLAYPFLTSGLRKERSDMYNLISLIFAIAVMISVGRQKIKAIYFTIPFVIWTTYVNIVTRLQ